MANYKHKAIRGFYKDHYCRSLGEFHVAMWLALCNSHLKFKTEPFRLLTTSGKYKVPDFATVDKTGHVIIWEVKPNEGELNEVVDLYKAELPHLFETANVSLRFINSKKFTKQVKNIITIAYGKDFYNAELQKYRMQVQTYTGFPGELNPMFGKKYTAATKALIAKAASRPGRQPNFMNGTPKMTDVRVVSLFSSYANFWNFIRRHE